MAAPRSGTREYPTDENVEVVDNPTKRRYEAVVDGAVAGYVSYQEGDGVLTLIHTEVGDEWEGRGIGSRLVTGALDDIRARGLKVTPLCRFAGAYIQRHPEYGDLVAR